MNLVICCNKLNYECKVERIVSVIYLLEFLKAIIYIAIRVRSIEVNLIRSSDFQRNTIELELDLNRLVPRLYFFVGYLGIRIVGFFWSSGQTRQLVSPCGVEPATAKGGIITLNRDRSWEILYNFFYFFIF